MQTLLHYGVIMQVAHDRSIAQNIGKFMKRCHRYSQTSARLQGMLCRKYCSSLTAPQIDGLYDNATDIQRRFFDNKLYSIMKVFSFSLSLSLPLWLLIIFLHMGHEEQGIAYRNAIPSNEKVIVCYAFYSEVIIGIYFFKSNNLERSDGILIDFF